MQRSLLGSEMCIRDRHRLVYVESAPMSVVKTPIRPPRNSCWSANPSSS
jgi:hypothetical protein